ncbi:hypothetical protein [Caballeronia grimmiae]|uniref:hypothetical protein n=1 Tax=Caballeronia grimmiae TaxID=1071679 RepID=UPI0038BC3B97
MANGIDTIAERTSRSERSFSKRRLARWVVSHETVVADAEVTESTAPLKCDIHIRKRMALLLDHRRPKGPGVDRVVEAMKRGLLQRLGLVR